MENSYVHPNAKIGANVKIHPFCYIAENVVIGDGCEIGPNATIYDYVTMGKNCKVFPGAVVGAIPHDLKFDNEVSYVEIGDNVTIRECATINRGTAASGNGKTTIGNNTLIMSYAHVAHDCEVGNNCILVSYVGIAGETIVDDWAIIGGASAAHQFSNIGTHAMVGCGSRIAKDIPPYAIAMGSPAKVVKYRFDEDTIAKLLKIRWWDFKEEEIVNIIPLLQSNNMEEFLRQYCE
jgi:UDP-N-acetylglucosamine acyltransferase